MLTHFQCDKCHFRKIQRRDPEKISVKDGRLFVTIRWATLDYLWSKEPGKVKGNLTTMKRLGQVGVKKLGMETWLPTMGTFPLVDELGMSLACTNLRFYLINVRHAGHFQWYSMRKAPTAWENIYGAR